jgi:transcriptional regulator with XRE-family HTH domain
MPGSPRGRSFAEGGAQALGSAIRTARRHSRITQEELARAVGRDKSTIERLESGRQSSLNDALVEQVADALGADEVTLQHWKDLALNGPGATHYLADDDEDDGEGDTLAERVRVMVESSHRSQATFARQAGISARTLQRILADKTSDGVTVKVAEGLATAAGLSGQEREAFIAFGCCPGRSPVVRHMIGRRNDLARVADGLARTGFVTITGPPGVGKTLLGMAVAEARQSLGEPSESVFLRAIPERTSLAAGVAMSKGLDLPSDEAPDASLVDHAPASGLWFLDNVEHLTGVESVLESLRASRPDLLILVTKPVPLGVSGEVTVDLAPLPPRSAVRLLRARIAAARPLLPAPSADDPFLDGICARIGHLPLVIELVANWFTDRSPAEVSASLDTGEHLVTWAIPFARRTGSAFRSCAGHGRWSAPRTRPSTRRRPMARPSCSTSSASTARSATRCTPSSCSGRWTTARASARSCRCSA